MNNYDSYTELVLSKNRSDDASLLRLAFWDRKLLWQKAKESNMSVSDMRDCEAASSHYEEDKKAAAAAEKARKAAEERTAEERAAAEKKAAAQKAAAEKKAAEEAAAAEKAKQLERALREREPMETVISQIIDEMKWLDGLHRNKRFGIAKTPVTQRQWTVIMGSNPSEEQHDDSPVTNISWNDCNAFIEKVNSYLDLRLSGLEFRLPTEEEWEYACRAGSKKKGLFSGSDWGMKADGKCGPLKSMGWYASNVWQADYLPPPVAQLEPNALGLYDMHGNVWEWTDSNFADDESEKVCRGGSYHNGEESCSASHREPNSIDFSYGALGFRICASSLPKKALCKCPFKRKLCDLT